MRICSALLLGFGLALLPAVGGCDDVPKKPGKDPKTMPRTGQLLEGAVIEGAARFTVITPTLLRLEYDPKQRFEDRPSFFAVHRHVDPPVGDVIRKDGALEIVTDRCRLRYRPDGRPFHKDNLEIGFRADGLWQTWKPGMENEANLGGTVRTLDGCAGPLDLGNGVLSRDGWFLLDDSKRHVFTKTGWIAARDKEDATDWFFFGYGRDHAGALRDLTTVAGRVPLPSKYTLGCWYSRYWPYTSEDYRDIVAEYREHSFPLDVMVLDMDWHLDGWTGYTWNRKLLPDAEDLLAWLHDEGLRVTLNVHPHSGVGRNEAAFEEFAANMGLDPTETKQIPFDITDPEYVTNYFQLLHHPLEKQGVDFWWVDWQQGRKSKIVGLDPLAWLNHLHFGDRARPEGGLRGQSFSRWGGWGDHRHPIHFSGDTYSTWRVLEFLVPFTATAGNVGCFYWSHDIGGHFGSGRTDPELYARWVQFGSMSAALRSHSTRSALNDRRPWLYGEQAEDAMRKAFLLRSRFFPYIYSCARQCYEESAPLLRPMYYEYPEIEESYANGQQYLLGPDLLVSPVVTPGDKPSGLAPAQVWCPEGSWYHSTSHERIDGPSTSCAYSTLDEFPVYVRAGVPIPMQRETLRMSSTPLITLVVTLFPEWRTTGPARGFTLYEDDGESADYLEGGFATTRMTARPDGDGVLQLTIGPAHGTYRGQLLERGYEVVLPQTPKPLSVELAEGEATWRYDPHSVTAHIAVEPRSIRQGVELTVRFPTTDALQNELDALTTLITKLRRAAAQSASMSEVHAALTARLDLARKARAQIGSAGALGDPDFRKTDSAAAIAEGIREVLPLLAKESDPVAASIVSLLTGMWLQFAFEHDEEGRPFGLATIRGGTREGDLQEGTLTLTLRGPERAPVVVERSADWSDTGSASARFLLDLDARCVGCTLEGTLCFSTDWNGILVSLTKHVSLDKRLLTEWSVVGPFPGGKGPRHGSWPPEETVSLDATYEGRDGKEIGWRPVDVRILGSTPIRFVSLWHCFPHTSHATAYAVTYIHASEDTKVDLEIRTDDGAILWINGEEVYCHEEVRAVSWEQDTITVDLEKGWNTLLAKIDQVTGQWGFAIGVVPDGASVRLTQARRPVPSEAR